MINIATIQKVLMESGYMAVLDNDPAIYRLKSSHTGRPIIFHMGVGDQLPVSAVRHLLQFEPNVDMLIHRMQS